MVQTLALDATNSCVNPVTTYATSSPSIENQQYVMHTVQVWPENKGKVSLIYCELTDMQKKNTVMICG